MPSDLDILMARIGEINNKPAVDVTDLDKSALVAYHRYNRSRRVAGFKPDKATAEPGPDILALIGQKPRPTPPAPPAAGAGMSLMAKIKLGLAARQQ